MAYFTSMTFSLLNEVRCIITGYLQELVYKLSKVGQAIENNDLSAASSVLGPSTDADWVQNVKSAFTKVVRHHVPVTFDLEVTIQNYCK